MYYIYKSNIIIVDNQEQLDPSIKIKLHRPI